MPFGFRRGKRSTGMGKQGDSRNGMVGFGHGGPPTNCICPQCGLVIPHEPGTPCFQRKCPQCGSFMTRQFLKIE